MTGRRSIFSHAASDGMIGLVRACQLGLSPWLGHACRFQLTRSSYAIEAIRSHRPLRLWLFTRQTGVVDFAAIPDVLFQWFLIPFAAAQALRFALEGLLSGALLARLSEWVGFAIPLVTAALIVQIIAANIGSIAGHLAAFAVIVIAIVLFFVAIFLMGEGLARLAHPQQALLAMTTAARNAPLMLAVTAVAIPDQPLILAAIVIGMLVEFPHLTALKQVLLGQAGRKGVSA